MANSEVIRSLIVDDHLEGPRPLDKNIIYFYCDYADLPTLQPQHIYRALLQQLFFKGLMNEAIEKSIVEALRSNIHSLSEQKLADFLRSTIESCPSLHIIIDGLDECDRDIQQDVTNTLYRLMSCGHFVLKILVTCRDEGHLLAGISIFSRLHVSRRASAADMQAYISHAISSSISSGQLTLRNMALKDEIISRLVAKAQGMYVSHDRLRGFECRILKLLGFSGCTFKSLIYATQLPMKLYAKSSTIYRKDYMTHTRGSS